MPEISLYHMLQLHSAVIMNYYDHKINTGMKMKYCMRKIHSDHQTKIFTALQDPTGFYHVLFSSVLLKLYH